MGRYQEAIQVLNSIQNRDASWYYLYAISNYSIGNQIAAMEAAERACQMDPSNQQYRQLYAQMQTGRTRYQSMQSPFGGGWIEFLLSSDLVQYVSWRGMLSGNLSMQIKPHGLRR